jgi:serine/threonine protein kinase/tetratricopeptide (TPR) repeat protein
MTEQRFSHYRILRQIGSGGMGVVYLARDEHLQCDVAIKVLPSGILADEDTRRRFRQEALAIAKRAHPNLVAVRDFDTQDGIDFLVMENVEGEGLDRMLRNGPLSEEQVVAIGAQLAQGLAAAHGAGVIHRDIKPGNVKVTPDGVVKILDFGLAKLRAASGEEAVETAPITGTGRILGTVPYLAPEVLLGSPANERSDIYSAGVVLYEMATGHKPHTGSKVTAVANEIVTRQPPPPSRWNPDLSGSLESVIQKAMDRDPDRRYASAADLESDLRRAGHDRASRPGMRRRVVVAGAAVALGALVGVSLVPVFRDGCAPRPSVASLAVLPLRGSSGDPSQEYFADGMTDELITTLSGITNLSVISRTSAMAYKGSRKAAREIARELKVRWIVEGSVVRVDSLVRINASLVDASRDKSLWARHYEGSIHDVLSLQAEVARAISRDVHVVLTPSEKERLQRRVPVVPEAMDAYLQGNYYWNQREGRDVKRAISYYENAIALDPRFAKPHAGLADVYGFLGNYSLLPQDFAYRQAKASALRALELEPGLGEAHASVAVVKLEYEWDWPGAEREFQRAIELSPGYATAHQWYSDYLSRMGRHREAHAQISRALELDPLSSPIRGMKGTVCYHARDFDGAVENYRLALESNPDQVLTRFYLGLALLAKGDTLGAIESMERADATSGGVPLTRAGLGYAFAAAGRRDEALRIDRELRSPREGPPVSSSFPAMVRIGLGDKDAAFRHLEEGFARRDSYLGHLKVAPVVDALRDDPRFQDLLKRLKLDG